ncbi:prolyl oligopeptidase family serine peptidase [Roseiconus lacunae]|uniref:Prolyl oligopeptidase family serine peptidase n=1 Tax=Roseiconus lacunae TaxID=2605694 RepID=A0ABT7PEA6_9BACT|nr:prolyl oligopeptidase family serine peptidase [Roseiconus lacunae]MDM4014811.1 prolyl oligopeptidase family serine peptidase [Roseiconus lacunae]
MRSIALFSFTVAVLCGSAIAADDSTQTAERLDVMVPVQLHYLLSLPEGYSDSGDPMPLLLFLHGAGERGSKLEQVKKHGPPKLIEAGQKLPFIVVSPQCGSGKIWQPHQLTALLDDVVKKYNVDENRIYVTGLSMGGFGTWALAAYTPERFAAVAPICGGSEAFRAKALKGLPIWVFHGAKDSVVPLSRSETMVEALRKVGNEPKFTVYPEALHDSWTETYNNPELYEWFLSHKKR